MGTLWTRKTLFTLVYRVGLLVLGVLVFGVYSEVDFSELDEDGHQTLCHALCLATCIDGVTTDLLNNLSNASLKFDSIRGNVTACDQRCDEIVHDINKLTKLCKTGDNCAYSCSGGGVNNTEHRPQQPHVTLRQDHSDPYTIKLTWQDTTPRLSTIIYVIQSRDVTSNHWITNRTTTPAISFPVSDVCAIYEFRIASVNRYGSLGFSARQESTLPRPSEVTGYRQDAPIVYENDEGEFHTQVSWDKPAVWKGEDIVGYKFHPQTGKVCRLTMTPPVPIATDIQDPSGRKIKSIRIHASGYSCIYFMRVEALSRCVNSKGDNIRGKSFFFDINLTNCSQIQKLTYCPVTSRNSSFIQNVTSLMEYGNRNVTVRWRRNPQYKNDQAVKHYILQWGTTEYMAIGDGGHMLLPKLQEEGRYDVPPDQHEANISVNEWEKEYGIKVIGVGSLESPGASETQLAVKKPDNIFTLAYPTPKPTDVPAAATPTSPGGSSPAMFAIIPVGLLVVVMASLYFHTRYKRSYKPAEKVVWTVDGKGASLISVSGGWMKDNPFYEKRGKDKWEVPSGSLALTDTVLGRGAFGQVVLGQLRISKSQLQQRIPNHALQQEEEAGGSDTVQVTVAVKMLVCHNKDSQYEDFLKEIELMKRIGAHPNVVSMLGCCTVRDPICLIVEHMIEGDLLNYLRRHRHLVRDATTKSNRSVTSSDQLTYHDLLSFARQIAVGMEFLSQKGFVHRDLASRNVLVETNRAVKIGDFGLTRYIYDDKVYVTQKGGKLPLKWMAIEAVFDLTFSTQSDIWSYGVVLFEIITLGGTPYPTIANQDILKRLKEGYRMEKPDNCSDQLYSIMCACWREQPNERPSFTELRTYMEQLMEEISSVDYLSIHVDESRDYYHTSQDTEDNDTNIANIPSTGSLNMSIVAGSSGTSTSGSDGFADGSGCSQHALLPIPKRTVKLSGSSSGVFSLDQSVSGSSPNIMMGSVNSVHSKQADSKV